MKLLEQLQNPKIWGTVIPLLVSAGLFEFTDSQAGDIAAYIAALFAALYNIAVALFAQKGDNDANVEMARGVSRGAMAREIALSEPRSTLEADMAEQFTLLNDELYNVKLRLRELEQARTLAANNVYADRRAG